MIEYLNNVKISLVGSIIILGVFFGFINFVIQDHKDVTSVQKKYYIEYIDTNNNERSDTVLLNGLVLDLYTHSLNGSFYLMSRFKTPKGKVYVEPVTSGVVQLTHYKSLQ